MSQSDAEKLRQRNHELLILNTIAQALNREVDLRQALQTTLTQVAELLDLETGWIFLMNEDTGEPYPAASLSLPPALATRPNRMAGRCYCLDTYEAGDLDGAANVNVVTCSRLSSLIDGTDGLRYHASIPLYARDKKLGVLNVASRDWRELSADDLRLLYTIGDMLSIAIGRAQLFDQSTQLGMVEERNRLAREIHDTLAQGLAALTLKLEAVDEMLATEADKNRLRPLVEQALALTRANLTEVRRSVLDLRAAPLEGRTLPEALQVLVDEVAGREKISIIFETKAAHRPLPLRIEVGLYRIVQEALNNIVRHAQATRIQVRLVLLVSQIKLTIEDNGIGFDPANIPERSFGIIGANERARLLGGTFRIESQPGAGARAEVVVPLEG